MNLSQSPVAHVAYDGRFIRCNQAWADLLGYTVDEVLKLRWQDVTHHDDITTDENLVLSVINGDRSTYQLKKRYKHKDGHYFWILLTVCLYRKEQFFISQAIAIEEQEGVWHD